MKKAAECMLGKRNGEARKIELVQAVDIELPTIGYSVISKLLSGAGDVDRYLGASHHEVQIQFIKTE